MYIQGYMYNAALTNHLHFGVQAVIFLPNELKQLFVLDDDLLIALLLLLSDWIVLTY